MRELVDRRPVGNDETVKPQLLLEQVGQKLMITVHLLAVPATVRGHDGADARLDRPEIAGQVNLPQRGQVALGVSLVDAVRGAAVTHEVLGAGEHRSGLTKVRAPEARGPPRRP